MPLLLETLSKSLLEALVLIPLVSKIFCREETNSVIEEDSFQEESLLKTFAMVPSIWERSFASVSDSSCLSSILSMPK